MKTKVIFRQFPNGEVIALFPELPGDTDPGTCMSYMHIGQHGTATARCGKTRLARPDAYAPLARELTGLGYDLQPVRCFSRHHYETRKAALRETATEG